MVGLPKVISFVICWGFHANEGMEILLGYMPHGKVMTLLEILFFPTFKISLRE